MFCNVRIVFIIKNILVSTLVMLGWSKVGLGVGVVLDYVKIWVRYFFSLWGFRKII